MHTETYSVVFDFRCDIHHTAPCVYTMHVLRRMLSPNPLADQDRLCDVLAR